MTFDLTPHRPAPISWVDYFLSIADVVATKSKDPSTKVGAILTTASHAVLSIGFNGPPRHVYDYEARFLRPAKYLWTSHAEENAIAQAARVGIPTSGAVLYCTHQPCARCARMIIQAGIQSVFWRIQNKTSMPEEEFQVSAQMFLEAGVSVFPIKSAKPESAKPEPAKPEPAKPDSERTAE